MRTGWGATLAVALLLMTLAAVFTVGVTAQDAGSADRATFPYELPERASLPGTADLSNSAYTVISYTLPYSPPFLIDDPRYAKTCFDIHTLTVYRPVQDGTPLDRRPVVFFVHGGGWTDGYADQYGFVSRSFSGELGWVTVVIDYRLTSDQVTLAENCPARRSGSGPAGVLTATKAAWYPDNIQDVAAALSRTVGYIGDYGGNPEQIVVFGHSAGGHLAALLATHPAYARLRPAIKGVVGLSGAYSVKDLNMVVFGANINQTWPGGITDTEALDEGSPTTYVTKGATLPPFYLLHCGQDLPSLPEQAIMFYNKLGQLGFDVRHDFLPGYDHVSEMAAIAFVTATPTVLIADFMEEAFWGYGVYLPLVARESP